MRSLTFEEEGLDGALDVEEEPANLWNNNRE